MQILETEVIESNSPKGGFIVEFRGDGGERVSVHLAQTESGALSPDNAVQKAQVLLLQASRFGVSDAEDTPHSDGHGVQKPSDAVESLRQEQSNREAMQHGGTALQEGLEDTYPASDPVSATHTSITTGERKQ